MFVLCSLEGLYNKLDHKLVTQRTAVVASLGGLFSMQHRVVFIVACSAGVLGVAVRVAMSFS